MIRTVGNISFKGKKVLIRSDLNVPLDKKGTITDDTRIIKSLETIKYILEQKPKRVVIMSHLGRPKGRAVKELRMNNIAERLSELIGMSVHKADDCVDVEIPAQGIVLLENLRFHKEEEENSGAFAEKLSKYGDIYVNDAFGTCHREHASVCAITEFMPSCAGLLLEREIKMLSKAMLNAESPFVFVLGGAKVSSKIKLIENMLKKADRILVGGAMIFTFYRAMGKETGKSIYEEGFIEKAKQVLKSKKIVLPVDVVKAREISSDADATNASIDEINSEEYGLDIGEESIKLFKEEIKKAKTIVWNGPMGVFEINKFSKGTEEIARAIAESRAFKVAGGGDRVAAIRKYGIEDKFDHVSTGGGAMIEFFEGKELPGIKALRQNSEIFK